MEVVNNRCFVEMRELRHIVCFVKLGRIDFIDAVSVDFSLLFIELAACKPFILENIRCYHRTGQESGYFPDLQLSTPS